MYSYFVRQVLKVSKFNLHNQLLFNLTRTSYLHPRCVHDFSKGPGLKEFIQAESLNNDDLDFTSPILPYLDEKKLNFKQQKVYFEVYGCQMNVNDSDIIWTILKNAGYQKTENLQEAHVIFLVTCAIRDGAESKIWSRLRQLKAMKRKFEVLPNLKIGLLGCMAERLKLKIVEHEKAVDVIAGPDSYRDLPRLLSETPDNETAINVLLSADETYADILPVRINESSKTAFVSIMRGCDNMCTYCIVPFTRGRERSRPVSSIIEEVKMLADQGIKEITLLGQNVNSYRDVSEKSYSGPTPSSAVSGFKTVYKPKQGGLRFETLLERVSSIDSELRIRFTSPHPKDFPDEVLHLIRDRPNICKSLHLPVQSGSSMVLNRMRRGYTRELYIDLVQHIRDILPTTTLSSDFIAGFCGETEDEFNETLSLMKLIKFNIAYTFGYSMREKTTAHRRLSDDVPQSVKLDRVAQLSKLFREEVKKLNEAQIGQLQLILIEGTSKKSNKQLYGRNDGNIKVIIPQCEIPVCSSDSNTTIVKPGDYIVVLINAANSQVLKGIPLYHSSIRDFNDRNNLSNFETTCAAYGVVTAI